VVWTCGADGGRKTTNRGFTRTRGGKEKQREEKEYLDGQYQGRPEGQNIELTMIGEATRNIEAWRSLIGASSSARWWRRENKIIKSVSNLIGQGF